MNLEEYKKSGYSIHQQIKWYKNNEERRKILLQKAEILKDTMEKENIFLDVILYDNYIALEPKNNKNETVQTARNILRKAFPDIEWHDHVYLVDKPTGTYILVRYINIKGKTIECPFEIWVQYEHEEDLPDEITNGGKCHFKKIKSESEAFVCEGSKQ